MELKNIFLEGEPGIGKTTLICRIADQLASFGIGGCPRKLGLWSHPEPQIVTTNRHL